MLSNSSIADSSSQLSLLALYLIKNWQNHGNSKQWQWYSGKRSSSHIQSKAQELSTCLKGTALQLHFHTSDQELKRHNSSFPPFTVQYLYRVAVRFWLLSFLPPSHICQASPKNGGKHISQPIFCWLANSFITTSVSPFLPSLFSFSFYEALCKQYTHLWKMMSGI